MGQGDIEGDVIVPGGQRLQIGADLVRDVAMAGGPVGADEGEIDLAMLHEMAAGIVGDDGVGDAVSAKLKGG